MLPLHTRQLTGGPRKQHILSSQSLKVLYRRPALRCLPYIFVSLVLVYIFATHVLDRAPRLIEYSPKRVTVSNNSVVYDEPSVTSQVLAARAQKIKDAYVHAYSGYRRDAWGYDELKPLTETHVNNFNGWGVSVIDSLDTMWIMGLHDFFEEGITWVKDLTFDIPTGEFVPFFETIIRYLGGMLSAHALSDEPILLTKASELGMMLMPAFNTPSGLPMYAVNPQTGDVRKGWTGSVLWAEALSNQMEYKYLAHLTNRPDFYDKTEKIMDLMYRSTIDKGQFPTQWDSITGKPTNNQFSVGAYADSAHEYLLKQWLLTSQSEPKARTMYLDAVQAIIDNLLYLTPNRELLYVTDTNGGVPSWKFEHLSCFLPGMLALGVHTLDLPHETKELHSWAADGIATTCWLSYADQASGLGPDEMIMDHPQSGYQSLKWTTRLASWKAEGKPGGSPPGLGPKAPARKARDYVIDKSAYLLRPETLESFYILWRTTGAEVWRDRGWSIFEAIEKHARLKTGYASVQHVDKIPVSHLDEMPSFFLAETLKYLYLMFVGQDIVPLSQWVFNTEAHPLPIFEWSSRERSMYRIPPEAHLSSNSSTP
ncbi:unnamed protein product [Mycena citricolor]|uniref:alpha-1,2-Mannosidase n=1 Tax=Mycena citricolor TaxID=2018698 RepID=A0AAD2K0B1_9AGAR|nr:unnamed protein product [Mycena citricolor]CAK5270249.1 unnamed protein product [Mycena citricolor]